MGTKNKNPKTMTNKQAKYIALQISEAIMIPAMLAIAVFGKSIIAWVLFGLCFMASILGLSSWDKLTNDEDELYDK